MAPGGNPELFFYGILLRQRLYYKSLVMAEMNTQSNPGKQRGGQRAKKLSTRVDMTPMVDLGFLLITFFMLTTTLLQPKTMDLIMPRDDGEPQSLAESNAMTVLLGANNTVKYYEGMYHPEDVKTTTYGEIREAIIKKKEDIMKKTGDNKLMVLIKADNDANYRNVVDIMDEMLINRVDRYAMVDITDEEKALLK